MIEQANIDFLNEGIVVPFTGMLPSSEGKVGRIDGGAYYHDGTLCQLSKTFKPNYAYDESSIKAFPTKLEKGSYIFGGLLQNEHFGHFISESISRLWALNHLSLDFQSIVYFLRKPQRPVAQFAIDFLRLLAPEKRIYIVKEATRFELLAIPQEMSKGGYVYGYPQMRRLCDRLYSDKPRSAGMGFGKKIYVSRSKLSRGEGGILSDLRIDEYLEAEGYTIIHPQLLSVEQQLKAYEEAEQIIFADGSAVHLFALVCRPSQKVFVIWRRNKYGIFDWQVKSFGGPTLEGEHCIQRLWIPELDAPDTSRGKAQISFRALSKQLRERGFIFGNPWDEPSESDIQRELDDISAEKSRKFVLRNLPSGYSFGNDF